MFDWITKPQIMWTPIDNLFAIFETVLFIIIIIKIAELIVVIIDHFDNKKGD